MRAPAVTHRPAVATSCRAPKPAASTRLASSPSPELGQTTDPAPSDAADPVNELLDVLGCRAVHAHRDKSAAWRRGKCATASSTSGSREVAAVRAQESASQAGAAAVVEPGGECRTEPDAGIVSGEEVGAGAPEYLEPLTVEVAQSAPIQAVSAPGTRRGRPAMRRMRPIEGGQDGAARVRARPGRRDGRTRAERPLDAIQVASLACQRHAPPEERPLVMVEPGAAKPSNVAW